MKNKKINTLDSQQLVDILEKMKKNPLMSWEDFLVLETALQKAIVILNKFENGNFDTAVEPMEVD